MSVAGRNYESPTPSFRGVVRYAGGVMLQELISELRQETDSRCIEVKYPEARDPFDRPAIWLARRREVIRRIPGHLAGTDQIMRDARKRRPSLGRPLHNIDFEDFTLSPPTRNGLRFGELQLSPRSLQSILAESKVVLGVTSEQAGAFDADWRGMPTPDMTVFVANQSASEDDTRKAQSIVNDHLYYGGGFSVELGPAQVPDLRFPIAN